MECVFCKIASGKIPSKKIYENEGAVAFLDINPLSAGHSLVIPKKHYIKSHEMDSETWKNIADALNNVCKTLVKKLEVEDYNILQNNGRLAHQEVMHVHFHIIPKTTTTGLELVWKATEQDIAQTYQKIKR